MSLVEFDYIIVGDEPAGLWCAQSLVALGERLPPELRIAWIQLAPVDSLPDVCLPTALAPRLGLNVETRFNAEVLEPRHSLLWRDAELKARFPALPEALFGPNRLKDALKPTSVTLSAIRHAIRVQPELLAYCEALWKAVGRSPLSSVEPLVLGALLCSELTWWRPWEAVPAKVERFRLADIDGAVEEMQPTRAGGLSLKFRDLPPLLSHGWVLNTSYAKLSRLCSRVPRLVHLAAGERLNTDAEPLYPLELEVSPGGVPLPVRPMSVWMDTENIPDVRHEIWPFAWRDSRRLTLWVNTHAGAPLEALAGQMREGMKRLTRLFPFLPDRLVSAWPPLDPDACTSDERRKAILDAVEASAVERYQVAALRSETRHGALRAFFPSLYCHLPYPLGPALAAERWLSEITRRTERKAKRQGSSALVPPG